MHRIKIMHRDIKLENIMLHDNRIKIVDLGFAKQIKDEE